jgi:uncharacterized protein YfaS (alpha-2-macroglobulin family)
MVSQPMRGRFGRLRIAFILLLVSTAFHAPALPASGPAAVITQFSPEGTTKNVRQVTAKFSRPMVPLGSPRPPLSPFAIDCPEDGTARWLDSFTWAYDFTRDLPAGERCEFTLRAGVRALDGSPVQAPGPFSFDTGGPSVVDSRPWNSSEGIDERQAFLLILDSEADSASVIEHAGFSVEGIPEHIGVSLIGGTDRAVIEKRFERAIDHRPFVIVEAKQRFPNDAKVSLVWGKGIRSASGVATAEDQTLEFKVRPAFEAKVSCERENPKAGCIPLTPIRVNLTSEIPAAAARQITLVAPDGARIAPRIEDSTTVLSVEFAPPFKESSQYTILIPDHLMDDSGRALANASRFPYPVRIDQFPPLAKFSARFGIIESVDPVLPVTVRNLEADIRGAKLRLDANTGLDGGFRAMAARLGARLFRIDNPDPKAILTWLRRVAEARRTDSVFQGTAQERQRAFDIPKPNGPNAFEVMGIPLKGRGLYVVELESRRLGSVLLDAPKTMYVPTAALVTNLAVHLKQGRANSLVWVTELESARPVAGAEVAISDCKGARIWSGSTDARGIAMVPRLDAIENPTRCETPDVTRDPDYYSTQTDALRDLSSGLLVTARHGGDFSFVHSSWKNGIEPWRFHVPTEYQPTTFIAHTVFDRTLLRAGETVHMKHFIRKKTIDGFGLPAPSILPQVLTLHHVGDDRKYELPIAWNSDGTATSEWKIPADARLGRYDLEVAVRRPDAVASKGADGADTEILETGSFNVEQFRVPFMKAAVKLPAEPQIAVTRLPVDISVAYLSGGAARGLPVILRSQITPARYETFADFDDFSFANGPVKEGVFKSEVSEEGGPEPSAGVHQQVSLKLDDAGGARSEITNIARAELPQTVRAEIEFRDANGEIKTAANEVTVWPAGVVSGIHTDDWTSSPDIIRARIAVVDTRGKPVANAPVEVFAFSQKYFSYRKRLVGGFYSYENTREVKSLGKFCGGTTDGRGILMCEEKPPATGEVILAASARDSSGNVAVSHTSVYVPGHERMWFEGRDDDRIDVLAEKSEYQVGETARFQVRMPFSEATALVTVEREGVIAASVIRLSGNNPVVTLPVRDYAPNAFVSVLAVRGRVAGVAPTAMLDLGKPAFRLGIAGIKVGWQGHRLAVSVAPDRPVYHVREVAHVKVAARAPDGKPAAGAVVTLAAVDEGLLELRPNTSWKLLDAMMEQRAYQVETSTAEMQVVGRRHFGLKAISPGGGGGSRVTRELFDTLLVWKPNVMLDSNGEARIDVPLNDSLTSFRIVAVAAAGTGRFGTGATSIRSTQDLQLYSGVPPIARIGDSFPAEFTVRNASDRAYDVRIGGTIAGIGAKPPETTLMLAPGEGKTFSWPVTAPEVDELKYEVEASVAHGPSDRLRISQRIIPAVPVRTLQATLVQLDKPVSQPVAVPPDALKGRGGIDVRLAPSLAAGVGGIEKWMREYPYVCLEQRVSRAIALRDRRLWEGIVAELASYTDSDGLLKYFPSMREGSDVLTSYVLAIADEAGFKLPADAVSGMETGLVNFVEGKLTRREPLAVADLPMRKLAAIEALARYGKADAALLSTITIDPALWPDSAVIDWWSILARVPSLPEREKRMAEAQRIMRARLTAQGTALNLSSQSNTPMWWLMVSPQRNILRLILVALDSNAWHDDLPRLMRGALALQRWGTWYSTISNAWGVLAMEKFAAVFEKEKVGGITQASLAGESRRLEWSTQPQGGTIGFQWPPAEASLELVHQGTGRPWAQIASMAAVPLKAPISNGYRITRTIKPVDSSHPGEWKPGDLVRVHLTVDAQADMTWVVLDDPIAAGASQVGVGFAGESRLATAGENRNARDYLEPAFIERALGAFRAYYDYVPKGKLEIEYTIRLNQAGTFKLPPTHVEALYEPEMMGELPNEPFVVTP